MLEPRIYHLPDITALLYASLAQARAAQRHSADMMGLGGQR